MSKNLKRVPLDFDWPLRKLWTGFLNPYWDLASECPDCDLGHDRVRGRPDANAALFYQQWYGYVPFDPIAYGSASLSPEDPAIVTFARRNVANAPHFYMTPNEYLTALYKMTDALKTEVDHPTGNLAALEQFAEAAIARETRRLHALWRGQWKHLLSQADVDALVAGGRLPDFTNRPRTPEQAAQLEAQAAAGGSSCWLKEPNGYHPTAAEVNAWGIGGMGHDSLNSFVCIEARCAREGVPFLCTRCEGSGKVWPSPEIKQQCDDWEQTPPPTGEGYQLWDDCSEGKPVSPVFTTLDALCTWAADNATTFAKFTATAEEWKKMLDGGVVHHREGNNVFL